MSYSASSVRVPRWVSIAALVSLAVLASFGLRWCVTMVNHAMPAHCQSCAADMDVADHISWWQSQTVATATTDTLLLLVILVLIGVAAPATVPALAAAAVQFSRQRFKPPGNSYLAALLADGILNPKIYS